MAEAARRAAARYAEAVTSGRDDDALSWDGDDDPTLDVGARSPADAGSADSADAAREPVALPEGFTAVGRGSETVGRVAASGPGAGAGEVIEAEGTTAASAPPAPLGNAALIGLGVLGGVYLLFAIGWIIGGLRLQGVAQFLVSPTIYQVALWLAVLAAPIWFAVAYLLTRRSRTWVRLVWLLAGAVLLVPWPFIMVGTVGQ